jgi:hypothetical protein
LNTVVVTSLDRGRACAELDLRPRLLGFVRQVLVEGSAIKNPRDWGLTLEFKNLA